MKRTLMIVAMLAALTVPLSASAGDQGWMPPEWTPTPPARPTVDLVRLVELLEAKGVISDQDYAQLTQPQWSSPSPQGQGVDLGRNRCIPAEPDPHPRGLRSFLTPPQVMTSPGAALGSRRSHRGRIQRDRTITSLLTGGLQQHCPLGQAADEQLDIGEGDAMRMAADPVEIAALTLARRFAGRQAPVLTSPYEGRGP